MTLSRRSISFLLILSSLALSGCHTTHAHSAPAQPSAAPAPLSAPPAAKHAARDSEFSVYHNPSYGISFRYPRTYLLDESSDTENSTIAEAQQVLDTDQPGATLVALVSIPSDAYPNTTFRSGTLQFVVNPAWTSEICVASIIPNPEDAQDSIGASTISGVQFHWLQSSELAQHRSSTTRVYNAFVNGACYEFQLEVTTEPSFVPGFDPKPADAPKILRQLEKIINSLQIHTISATPSTPGLPVVHSFTVAPLSHPGLEGVYRASWQIAGASNTGVFISVACSPAVGVYHLSDPASGKAGFPCGIFTPAAPQAGALDFQLDNRAPREVPVTVTLFLPTLGYGTRTVLVPSSR